MTSYPLLDQAEEDSLHRSRLLNNEEKPFRRITKRLLAPDSLVSTHIQLLPTPPPDASGDSHESSQENDQQKQLEELRQFREDVLLDFANFESSLVRMQFILQSNEQERQRYASEKTRILATAEEVRNNTVELRTQLDESQKSLALRKTYDELAEKITNNRMLKPREDQRINLEKLNNEIADLERESKEYAQTWVERREQFGKIIEEGMQLRRLIRDEKEEVERREGMEGREEHEDGDVGSARGRSVVGTPRPEAGGSTPLHAGIEGDPNSLAVDRLAHGRAKSPLRTSTPIAEHNTPKDAGSEDVNMAEDGEVSIDGSEGLVAEEKEGSDTEDRDEERSNERMDTT